MNKTALKIMTAAEMLFKKHGCKRVTIDEICRTAAVSKMTFYKYFPNKTDLAIIIIRRIADTQRAAFRELMARDIPFTEKVRETIRMKLEASQDFGTEWPREIFENPDTDIFRFLQGIAGESAREVRKEYETAQKNGDIRADVRMDFIFYFLDHIQTMLQDERLLGMYDSFEAMTSELMNFFFWGILPRGTS